MVAGITSRLSLFFRKIFPRPVPVAGADPVVGELAVPPLSAVSEVAECRLAALAFAALIALRVVYAFVYRVDSDEPQHLHVVWAWTQGLLPYRDIFDNHSPLFQMLCAPLFGLLGEHAWIVIPMRLAMLPLYAADLWLIFLVGRVLYARQWAVWIALAAGAAPLFFLVTTEFRTDDLWTTLWLAAVWLAVSGPMGGRRAFLFGLAMGACCAVSMKTAFLMAAMGTGAGGVLALHALSRRRIETGPLLKSAALIGAGMAIVPLLLVAFFAAHGALHQMYYCVVQHNAAPGLGKWRKAGFHLWLYPLSLPALLGLGWLCMRANERTGSGRALILIAGGAYYFLLRSYCPLVTAQDFLPLLPLAALVFVPFLFHLLSLPGLPRRIMIPAAGILLLGYDAARIWRAQSPLDNEMALYEQSLAVALHLTNPDDLVMDGKGETIYRKRPIYWVLEGVTIWRMEAGLIPDDVKEKMIRTKTCVAMNHRLRPGDQKWLEANFLEGDGKIWVAGKSLGKAHASMTFHTDITARYSIVSDSGKLAGRIDGMPLLASVEIAPGDHELEIAEGKGNVALVWAQALERGFNPFSKAVAGVPQ
jgi:hypothetical protein